jgi:hypothetical protein
MGMFCRWLFVLLYFFLLAIAVSVLLRFTDSDYTFGIFKLSLEHIYLPRVLFMDGEVGYILIMINDWNYILLSLAGIADM